MSVSVLLARLIGLYLFAFGLFFLLRFNFVKKLVGDFFDNSALVIYSGAINLILGLLIVLNHNIWEASWRVVITIIGYLLLLRGLARLFVPLPKVKKFFVSLVEDKKPIYIGLICLIIALYLLYHGFVKQI